MNILSIYLVGFLVIFVILVAMTPRLRKKGYTENRLMILTIATSLIWFIFIPIAIVGTIREFRIMKENK